MVTPWSTNAVEITVNMGVEGVSRIEEYRLLTEDKVYDPMLERLYDGLDGDLFAARREAGEIEYVADISAYNDAQGLALSVEEVGYLDGLSRKMGRKLTDSEVYGFAQVNSEHCRHKIFNGIFVIDGLEKESSLFELIKKTSRLNPNRLVSAYKDNVAFIEGPAVEQFAPLSGDGPSFFGKRNIETVLSLKAETHNFPTTVEPFNGAATGTGGEIRDRLAGGRASLPLAGTAVYMTSYPRLDASHVWEANIGVRPKLYHLPDHILIRASDGASDFGNKYGQPLICGSLLTFEHSENGKDYGYDKVIMMAGGIGYANRRDALKGEPPVGGKIVVMGGDNYRIGMGGGAVSSVDTGSLESAIEMNAVQRANPEMQKRVANVIRSLAESDDNPIVSIHDHGAGGHLNCLSELVDPTGGHIDMACLPVGDPTLSAKEIIGNESQERMGLLLAACDVERVERIALRERAPFYVVGETTDDRRLVFEEKEGVRPVDLDLEDMLGKTPRTVIRGVTVEEYFAGVEYREEDMYGYLDGVLRLEAVACKDWLTNKVDRSVTGKVARQQCLGPLQLPLSDLGAVALDYNGKAGMATSIGHAPQAGIIDPAAGSTLSIAEALTNLVFAPLKDGLTGVSLSANWMWPCRNEGEDARLYAAVEAASVFASSLGINIPTGKDSLSMTRKCGEGKVLSPGTVIISAAGEVSDVRRIVSPVIIRDNNTYIYYIDFSSDGHKLGGSALAQSMNRLGDKAPTVRCAAYFAAAFGSVQEAIRKGLILSGHDISAGGMITTLHEMCFANTGGGLDIDLTALGEDLVAILFAENPGLILQVGDKAAFEGLMQASGISFSLIGRPVEERYITVDATGGRRYRFDVDRMREAWYSTSYAMDVLRCGALCAGKRLKNYKAQPVVYNFTSGFTGLLSAYGLSSSRNNMSGVRAAIIRNKGTNGEREMAYALHLAGFDVKDVHLTDLSSGRETLEDVGFIVFCGGFSDSDVLGSAKGWAAGILYNEKARRAIDNFYARSNTLSLGVCNGCQLMAELGLLYPGHEKKHRLLHNESGKFEPGFVTVTIPRNDSVMLSSLSGVKTGVWLAHGEGRFSFPYEEEAYPVIARYEYDDYPGNPNGSPGAVAGICSVDGRHLAIMPHPERAIFPWQCAFYPDDRKDDDVTPWMEAFVNARRWIENK
jgi:phosphoribosylformylglycinamidine synthase